MANEGGCNIQKTNAHDAVKCVFAPRVDLQFTKDDDRERGTDEIGYHGPSYFPVSSEPKDKLYHRESYHSERNRYPVSDLISNNDP